MNPARPGSPVLPPRRRDVLTYAGCFTAAGTGVLSACRALASGPAHPQRHRHASRHGARDPGQDLAVLVDLSQCVGCRLCEYACKQANGIDPGPLENYDDRRACDRARRPSPDELTVVNAYRPGIAGATSPLYAKLNCMHCVDPACVSACIVGALTKQPSGAVVYDAWKCIGCRYCMVACPFQLPAYSYHEVLTPQVRKCQFCTDRTSRGEAPACVEACPQQALTFRRRSELITLAHAKINARPDRYVDHVYGEHEVGGTSWMYVSPVPFAQAGFLTLGPTAPTRLTEAIQHGVFKHWIAPIGWYGFLATMMWLTGRKGRVASDDAHETSSNSHHSSSVILSRLRRRISDEPSYSAPEILRSEDSAQDDATAGVRSAAAPVEYDRQHEAAHDPPAAPAGGTLLTPGVWVLIAMVLTGMGFGLYRFIFGLAESTNLNQQYPWGLWIAMDVGSGIALAGGGFVTAALVHIFHRHHYHAVARSALLTALLGYTFYVPGLLADIGRWYNIWHPTLPSMWQVNSVLFEVGICVMLYLTVQYAELAPIVCERFMSERGRLPRIAQYAQLAHRWLERFMPALLVLGVALSTFHQSSLGNLMVIAPYKLHHLWWTPISPLLFLVSAMMVGFPMVIFTILTASWALRRQPMMHVLTPLSLYVPVFLGVYLCLKVGDVVWRGVYPALWNDPYHSTLWLAEMGGGVVAPLVMLMFARVRRSPRLLASAMLAVILGVVLNRLNSFVLAYHPPYAEKSYFPSITEFAVSMGLVAALMLTYRVAVTYLPILPRESQEGAQ